MYFFKDQVELEKFRSGWSDFHRGIDNAHKLAIILYVLMRHGSTYMRKE
jgi:hypothetical protein